MNLRLKRVPFNLTSNWSTDPASAMKFKHVVIQSLAAVDPPIRVTSREIEAKLKPTLDRLDVRDNLLEEVSGIGARRFWERGTSPSDAATLAAEKALDQAGIERDKIGVIINTSVCRDYLEPSTACIVHGNLGLGEDCLNFDVGNACLAFMNGMDIAARMIERAEVDYALVVDGESSRPITEATIERMLQPDISPEQFRAEFASLTLGSGAAAMVMARRELAPEGSTGCAAARWTRCAPTRGSCSAKASSWPPKPSARPRSPWAGWSANWTSS